MLDKAAQEDMRLRREIAFLKTVIAQARSIQDDKDRSHKEAEFDRAKSMVCTQRADQRLEEGSPYAAVEYYIRADRYAALARFFDGDLPPDTDIPNDPEDLARALIEMEDEKRASVAREYPLTFYWNIHFVMCRSERRQFGGHLLEGYVDLYEGTEQQNDARYKGQIISYSASREDFPPIEYYGFYSQKDAMAWVERTMKDQESKAIK